MLLGILANVLFFDRNLGLSYPIFVLAFYGIFLWNTQSTVEKNFAGFLMIPVVLLSLTYLIFSNKVFYAINFIAIPILIVMQTTWSANKARGAWSPYHAIGDLFLGFLYRPFVFMALPLQLISKKLSQGMGTKKESNFFKITIGILVAVPLVAVIVALLASADQIFNSMVDALPNIFIHIPFETLIPRTIFSTVITLLSFSYIWSLMRKPKIKRIVFEDRDHVVSLRSSLDQVISSTLLSMINAIYVLFTLIQFSYLFGGFSFALPAEFTYAQYARRGFFELVLVTLINFSILLLLIYCTKKGTTRMNRMMQALETLLVFCTLIMLVSAFVRMYLYEQMYGYTYLRVFTHAFMIFLFVLVMFTLVRIWNGRMNLFKCYVLTGITALVLINFTTIDAFITKWNIDRYEHTGKIDIGYLTELSDDAVPGMIRLLHAKDDQIAGPIENYLYERKQELNKMDWQSFNFSSYHAKRLLSQEKLHYDKSYDY
nr:DUF4173 domain-containing protein [Sporolactobacillus kofuensis]